MAAENQLKLRLKGARGNLQSKIKQIRQIRDIMIHEKAK